MAVTREAKRADLAHSVFEAAHRDRCGHHREPDPLGHVQLDPGGKKSGRGAYLCARLSCWENAMKKKRLEQEFELTLSDEDRAGLEAFIATLPRD